MVNIHVVTCELNAETLGTWEVGNERFVVAGKLLLFEVWVGSSLIC